MLHSVHVKAPAKINLHLKVCAKRQDGFHDIESIFQKIPLYDELLIEMVDNSYCCQVVSPDFILPTKNTLNSAYNAFCDYTGLNIGIKIFIDKHIPSGAGLGGGSSDAGAVLRGLEQLTGVKLTDVQLHEAASRIGSDVFFFLYEGAEYNTAVVTGRGENVKYFPSRNDLSFVLVCPDVHSSTKEAYNLVDRWTYGNMNGSVLIRDLIAEYKKPSKDWLFNNSFTDPLKQEYPEIAKALYDLHLCNADFVQMTGSGSVVFGVFESKNDAKKAYTQLYQVWKRCFILTSS